MAAALPHSHIRLHLPPRAPAPSSRRLLLPSLVATSRLQNPTTATHPVLPPPAPPPSAALLAAEGASLTPRREHRFPGILIHPNEPCRRRRALRGGGCRPAARPRGAPRGGRRGARGRAQRREGRRPDVHQEPHVEDGTLRRPRRRRGRRNAAGPA
ncbi:unnamed protein product [Urochloa humidicola]